MVALHTPSPDQYKNKFPPEKGIYVHVYVKHKFGRRGLEYGKMFVRKLVLKYSKCIVVSICWSSLCENQLLLLCSRYKNRLLLLCRYKNRLLLLCRYKNRLLLLCRYKNLLLLLCRYEDRLLLLCWYKNTSVYYVPLIEEGLN